MSTETLAEINVEEARFAQWEAAYDGASLQQLGEAMALAHYEGSKERRNFLSGLIGRVLSEEQSDGVVEVAKPTATTGAVRVYCHSLKSKIIY